MTKELGQSEVKEDIFNVIVKEISEKTNKGISEIIALINKRQEELGNILAIEVVALIVAKEFDLDVSKYISYVEKIVLE